MSRDDREGMKMCAFKLGPTLLAHAHADADKRGETLGEWIRRAMQSRLPKSIAAGVPMLGKAPGRPKKTAAITP